MKTKKLATWLIVVCVVAIIAVLMTACGGETTTVTETKAGPTQTTTQTVTAGAGQTVTVTTTATATAPATTVTQTKTVSGTTTGETFKLTFVGWFASTSTVGQASNKFMDMVQERSGGRVQFTTRLWGGELGATDVGGLDALKNGLVDLVYVPVQALQARDMLSLAACQPGIVTNAWAGLRAYAEWSKLAPIQQEWAKYNALPMWPATFPPNTLLTRFPANTIADMKGKVIFGVGATAEPLKNIGAAPAFITPPEIYDALNKGTLDGVGYALDYSAGVWKWHEVAKYWVSNANFGGMNYAWTWNLNTFNKLPQDIQDMIVRMSMEEAPAIAYDICVAKTLPKLINEALPQQNVQVIKWSDADVKTLNEVGIGPVQEKWVKDNEAKGRPEARWLLETWKSLNKAYEAAYPAKAAQMGWTGLPY